MRKLAIAAAVSVGLGTFSANSLALGLGEIEMYSALNQSLDAEIGILSATPAEIEGLAVSLAPPEAFNRAGLDRLPILSAMRFRVERRPDGIPVVKITSDEPVVEPFLNFLLRVDSPQGQRLVREYTVLLDPPVFTAQRTQPTIANIPESTAVDIEKEIGASTPIDRVLNNNLPAVAEFVSDDEGVAVDLSNEGMAAPSISSDVDFSGGQPLDISSADSATISPFEPIVSEPAFVDEAAGVDVLLTESSLGEVVMLDSEVVTIDNGASALGNLPLAVSEPVGAIFTGDIDVSQPDAEVIEGGQLISLEAELAGDVAAETDSLDSGGITISLEGFSDQGAPIFEQRVPELTSAINALTVEIVDDPLDTVTGGVEVDLSELLPRQQPLNQGSSGALSTDVAGDVESGTSLDLADLTDAVAVDVGAINFGEEIDLSGELSSPTASQPSSVTVATDVYTVQPSDTLWSIARRNKPAGYSTQQMMVALLRANDGAFLDGDMNQMRRGATLSMPGAAEINSTSNADSIAIVRDQIALQSVASVAGVVESPVASVSESSVSTDSAAPEEVINVEQPLSIVGVDETVTDTATPATDQNSSGSKVARNLEEVNRRMQLAQEELASESMQRDELKGRVNELEDSMTKMKRLITLRESELSELQTELTTAKSDTTEAAADAEEKARMLAEAELEKDDMQKRLQELQEKIAANAAMAQDRVDEQADADKNLASAEAQAQSVRLATEEDTIRAQLAILEEDKARLLETAQNDKVELVRQAEAEKSELLAQAKAERERIMAELDSEKLRISEQAAADRQRIADEAQLEKEQLIAEATAEREKLAAESEAMRVKLVALEEEKAQLLAKAELDKTQLQEAAEKAQQDAEQQKRLQAEAQAEKVRVEEESARVKDRLAQLQAEASANLASSTESVANVVEDISNETAAVGVITPEATEQPVTEVASSMVEKGAVGAAAVGGLMAAGPLQNEIGDRKKVLAAGGAVALIGLLGAWATRRRKPIVKEDIDLDRGTAISRTTFDNRQSSYEQDEAPRSSMGSAAIAASAAAAAGGAAAAARSAAQSQDRAENAERKIEDSITGGAERVDQQPIEEAQADVSRIAEDNAAEERGSRLSDAEPMDDGVLLDDTITEAEVYLRYGLHGQAEDLLQTAIERSPDNEEYHFKLLENYHDQKNVEGFQSAATNFQNRFSGSPQWERVAEMGRDLEPGNTMFSRVTAMGSAAGGAAVAGGLAAASLDDDADSVNSLEELGVFDADETVDPTGEFNLAELEATGQFTESMDQYGDGVADLTDIGDVTLDEVDLAALDDDGTLNLEELAGDQMSGLDLGSLDLTNPDSDSTLDNLTLDDADLNSLGDVTSNLRSGLESDFSSDDLDGGLAGSSDEMETMLDLAKAYIDMGDTDSAASALQDIAANGNANQKMEATELLKNLT